VTAGRSAPTWVARRNGEIIVAMSHLRDRERQ
jgi:hypothetical protein